MAATVRTADYVQFLDDAYGDGDMILNTGKALKNVATSCAMFAGGCCINAGVQEKRPPPRARAITTWAGVRGFVEDNPETEAIEGSWIPAEKLDEHGGIQRGDIFYICSAAGSMGVKGTPSFYSWTRWEAAANGHVGICLDDGYVTRTAEGGGSPGGTGCRLSAAAKDIRKLGRTLRGVWRPNLMRARAVHDTKPDGFLELRRGMRGPRVGEWQTELLRLRYELPKFGADSDFGGETEAATRAFQIKNTIPNTGIVDRRTFDTARALEK